MVWAIIDQRGRENGSDVLKVGEIDAIMVAIGSLWSGVGTLIAAIRASNEDITHVPH